MSAGSPTHCERFRSHSTSPPTSNGSTPDAILLNFTNPAGLVTEALCRHTDVTTIGLCNVPWTIKAVVARSLRVEPAAVEFDYVGLNHLSWVRGVTVDGVDRTAEVLAGLRRRVAERLDHGDPGDGDHGAGEPDWTPEAIDTLAAIPNSYLRYYYETDRVGAPSGVGAHTGVGGHGDRGQRCSIDTRTPTLQRSQPSCPSAAAPTTR